MIRTFYRDIYLHRTTLSRLTWKESCARAASTTAHTSNLGLRSHNPPDSSSSPPSNSHSSPSPPELDDNEWEIRTGRATNLLRETLPQFFDTGLMVALDKTTGNPTHSTYGALSLPFVGTKDSRQYIYSPKIKLEYTRPLHLPTPLPETLRVEGIPLYLASSVFIRHTLNALYSDLRVSLTKFVVNAPKHDRRHLDRDIPHKEKEEEPLRRSKSVLVRMEVTGKARVSGSEAHWDVTCTYDFSPSTGMICSHLVNEIHPTPSDAVYSSLRSSFGLPDATQCHTPHMQHVPMKKVVEYLNTQRRPYRCT
ncbi:hypothetical protein DL96DRAFT_1598756 [Flagelloscypha sp. PMI_526]|nr:hypothetical protein DL96DRAFT_1598756 [Flagelloscypha sp. PMI_526]